MDVLRQPRWIVGHLVVVALVVLFVRLGFWQLDRHRQHVARNATIEMRADAAPLPLEELLGARGVPDDETGSAHDPGDDAAWAYRRVVLEGRFDAEHELLWRNHTYLGRPGWHVLTPFVPSTDRPETNGLGGRAVLVDRGWVPREMDGLPLDAAPPPSGSVRVEGIVLPEHDPPTGPMARFAARDPAAGPVERAFYVDVERLEPQMPYGLLPAYVVPTSMEPSQPADLPMPPEPPSPESASHLGYAIQWFAFALIGVVGYAMLLRHRIREHAAASPEDARDATG